MVVPVLDEAGELPSLIARLQALASAGCEVVVVDGGSRDGSAEALVAAGLRVIRRTGGRGPQLQAGAEAAQADSLLFLHADTVLPEQAVLLVRAALAGGRLRWGRFDVAISGRHPMLRVVAWLINWRSRLTGIATGDQALFMTRAALDAAGGFPAQPLLEDVEISTRLRALARPVCLRARVVTSGRRWERRGVWSTIWLMWRLRWLYWRGVPATTLVEHYR